MDRPGERRSPVEQFLDLTVYAPIGFLMSLDEVVPQLVEKGHQHVKVARFFGRMAVRTGTEEARRRFDVGTKAGAADPAGPATPQRPGPAPDAERFAPVVPLRAAPEPEDPARPSEPAPEPDTLGIPDYDVLSASQVVPRLPGLRVEELDAVRRYESANRGRKTILAKIAQLQGP